jgi:hypothetical protein
MATLETHSLRGLRAALFAAGLALGCSTAAGPGDDGGARPDVVPPLPCTSAADPAACDALVGCRWLEPGCTEPRLPARGCFPLAECAGDFDCAGGRRCREYVYDPCAGLPCNACGGSTRVCLP